MKTWKVGIGSLILVLLTLIFSRAYFFPSFEVVKDEFIGDERRIDELVAIFIKNSKIHYIRRYRSGKVDVVFMKDGEMRLGVPDNVDGVAHVDFNDVTFKQRLQEQGISLRIFGDIVRRMKEIGVASIASSSEKEKLSGKEMSYVEIRYPLRSSCGWNLRTPLKGGGIRELAETINISEYDRADGGEGPYIINDRWLAYISYCTL